MKTRSRWRKVLLRIVAGGALLLGLAAVAGFLWWRSEGPDFIWSKVRPDHAVLLEGEKIPSSLSAEEWAEDLEMLAREIPRRFARFDALIDRAAFDSEAGTRAERLPGLSRDRTIVELMGVATLPGTGAGHTGIPPFQRPLDWSLYPLYAWVFDDGVWIVLAGEGLEEAQGAEVLAVGGRPVGQLLTAAAPFLPADNDSGRKELQGAVLSFPEMRRTLGAVGEDGVAELTLRRPAGDRDGEGKRFTVRVEPVRLASLDGLAWGRTLQAPVDSASPADPRPRSRIHRLDYRPEDRLLYLGLHQVRNTEDQTLEELANRLLEAADRHEVERLVIDLRSNGGGNNQLVEPLVAAISGHPELDRRGVLYTLIGRRTFSAAGNLAAALELRTRTLFAGEPTGSSPNHAGDAVDLLLPRSKIVVGISSRYWEDGGPYDRRPWIAPSSEELAVPFSHADHAAGRDPVLDAVLAHRPAPLSSGPPLDPATVDAVAGRYRFDPFRSMTVEEAPDGGLRAEVRGVRTFFRSDLRPLPGDDGGRQRLGTHLPGVVLSIDPAASGRGGIVLDWRGVVTTLPRVAPEVRTPIEWIRGEEEGALERGIAAFRSLAAEDLVPDSQTELELNRIGYDLLGRDRIEDAVEVFRLQTELYPGVANSFDSLGDAYRRAGDLERATAAYRRSLELDPGFRHSLRMLDELDAD